MKIVTALRRCRAGSTAAEFGLVLPLLIAFLLGTIDIGRFMWTFNRAEKATQMGARYAVATDLVPSGLTNYSFVNGTTVTQGDPIPASAFTSISCTGTTTTVTCTCVPAGQTWCSAGDAAAFNRIVARMNLFERRITANNVLIKYEYSGLGYAGDPNGTDVAPLVTVKLTGMTFTPLLFRFFGNSSVPLPGFSAALTLEDGSGSVSN
jgi:hypothetical protein